MQPHTIRQIAVSLPVVLAFASLSSAQGTVISPPGYLFESVGSSSYSVYMGGYVEQRLQVADGNLRGLARVFTRVEVRRNTVPAHPMIGRSFRRVTLRLSDTNESQVVADFSANVLSPPTAVFDSSVNWRVPATTPSPAPFGDGGLSFPFRSPFDYTGRRDLLLDYEFSGGRREDAGPWASQTLLSYYLDGVTAIPYRDAGSARLGSVNCRDSAQRGGALQQLFVRSHSSTAATWPSRFYHYQETFNTAPGATIVQAVGIAGATSGIDVGACNRLWVTPVAIVTGRSDATGHTRLSFGTAPYDSRLTGMVIVAQSAWADSATGRLHLTNAAVATVSAQPPATLWRSTVVTTTTEAMPLASTGGWLVGQRYVPLFRYTTR